MGRGGLRAPVLARAPSTPEPCPAGRPLRSPAPPHAVWAEEQNNLSVTLSSGSPWLSRSPNREQKENCHVNIFADSNLLLFSLFPRLCMKSASSSRRCQMRVPHSAWRSA